MAEAQASMNKKAAAKKSPSKKTDAKREVPKASKKAAPKKAPAKRAEGKGKAKPKEAAPPPAPPRDVQAEAAALRERVRGGQLDPASLDLAAYVGHPPSRLAADAGVLARVLGRLANNFPGASPPPTAARPDAPEVMLGLSRDFYDCTDLASALEAADYLLARELERTRRALEHVLGPPAFAAVKSCDPCAAPRDLAEEFYQQGFTRIVCWLLGGGRALYIGLRHADREAPLELVGGLRAAAPSA